MRGPNIERVSSLFESGDIEGAAAGIQLLLLHAPNDPQVVHLAGLIYAKSQRYDEARSYLERAASLAPKDAFVRSNLAFTLRELGEPDAAIKTAQQAIALDPQLPDAHNNLASALKDQGYFDQALAHFRQAVLLMPENGIFRQNVAMTHLEAGNLGDAESIWLEMLDRDPGLGIAFSGLGEVAAARKQWRESRQWFMRALEAGYRDARVHNALGQVHEKLREYRQAFEQFKQALAIDPEQAGVWYNLGCVLEHNENQATALEAYQEAYKRGLRTVDVKRLLLNALVSQSKIDEAYDLAMKMLPDAQREPELLPPLLKTFASACDFSRREEVWRLLDEAISQEQLDPHAIDACLMLSCYPDFLTEERILSYHRAWARQVEAAITALPPADPVHSSGRRIRIGYISSDFRRHSVGFFIQHVLVHHDRSAVEIFCYSNSRIRDAVTDHIEQHVDHFIEIWDLDDPELAGRIRTDGIDILIDLAGHTAGHRLTVFPYRPAPVALTWIGYLHTTGLRSVEYRISDPFVDAEERVSGAERLLRLPQSFLCIGELPKVDVSDLPPCLDKGYVLFASFNNLQKLNRSVIRAWSRILDSVPNSRLVIMANRVTETRVAHRHIQEELARHGVDPNRLEFQGHRSHVDYLCYHNEVDIVLDSFPFNGGTVTAGALWMGVPVVTLAGSAHRQRVSYSMLKNIRMEETIAWDEDQYVAKAVRLARDPQALTELRRHIAETTRHSILCDPPRFTRQLEAALRQVWKEHCSGSVPEVH